MVSFQKAKDYFSLHTTFTISSNANIHEDIILTEKMKDFTPFLHRSHYGRLAVRCITNPAAERRGQPEMFRAKRPSFFSLVIAGHIKTLQRFIFSFR